MSRKRMAPPVSKPFLGEQKELDIRLEAELKSS